MRNVLPPKAKLVPEHANLVFKGKIYDTYQWEQELYDGSTATYEMLKRPDTVKVVAVKDNKIVICKQEQPNAGLFYDFPGGMHDEELEDELQAAKRELLEETGFVCKNWKLVSCHQPHSKIEQFVYVFVAWEVIDQKEQKLDAGEKIEVEFITLEELKENLHTPEYRSSMMEWLRGVKTIEELLEVEEIN